MGCRWMRSLSLLAPGVLLMFGCPPEQRPALFVPAPKTIDHTNFDSSSRRDVEIRAAALLRVYFEHASVGGNIFSDSANGFDALRALNSRYDCDRISWTNAIAPAWFATHHGLADNDRGNPGAIAKIDHFQRSLTPQLASELDVASFKLCWIDSPSDPNALFAAARSMMEAVESQYPSVVFVWWTMPLERDTARPARQIYNELVREYCASHDKWLLDIAALESHDDAGNLSSDPRGHELQAAGYSSDGGHLNAAGAIKLAKAYWQLISAIAAGQKGGG